ADIVDRRRLLIGVQIYFLFVISALAMLTWLELTTPWALLGFTFAVAVGTALAMPAWAAVIPELVPRDDLQSAVALNSIAINVSRAIGPAIAGVLVAAVGAWLVFALNALSCIGILVVLYALAALALAHVQNLALLMVAMLATGAAWISILSALQVSAQLTLPEWVRARGLAAFIVVFMGGMGLGSVLWGQVATAIGIPSALTAAAAGMVAAVALTWRF